MSLRSAVLTLRHNPALCVALFIPMLSIVVAGTLLTFAIGAQQDTANAANVIRNELPPMSKTSWREPFERSPTSDPELDPELELEPESHAESTAPAAGTRP